MFATVNALRSLRPLESALLASRPGHHGLEHEWSVPMDEIAGMKAIGRMMDGCSNFFLDAFAALQVNGISGDYAEFGCHTGGSFQAAYHAQRELDLRRHMWAFDSWQPLPDDHPLDSHPGWVLGAGSAGGVDNFHAACAAQRRPSRGVHDGRGLLPRLAPSARLRRSADRHRARVHRL